MKMEHGDFETRNDIKKKMKFDDLMKQRNGGRSRRSSWSNIPVTQEKRKLGRRFQLAQGDDSCFFIKDYG